MNNLPRLLLKLNPWAVKISAGLSMFYVFGGIYLLTQGLIKNGLSCFLMAAFFGFMVLLNKIAKLAQLKVAKVATILRSLKREDFHGDSESASKLMLFLFNLDVLSVKTSGSPITNVLWFKKNHRPTSDLIASAVNSYLNSTLVKDEVQLSEKEKKLIQDQEWVLKDSLIEINAKVKTDCPELDKLSENELIRLKA